MPPPPSTNFSNLIASSMKVAARNVYSIQDCEDPTISALDKSCAQKVNEETTSSLP